MKTSKSEVSTRRTARAAKVEESPPKSRPAASPSRSPGRSRKTSRSRTGKSPSRKSPSRNSPPRKSPARKSPARKSPARKSPARKSPARKSPARKSPARKSSSRNSEYIEYVSKSPSRRPDIRSLKNASATEAITAITTLTRPRRIEPVQPFLTQYSLRLPLEVADNQNGFDSLSAQSSIRDSLEHNIPTSEHTVGLVRRSIRIREGSRDNYTKLLNLAQSTKLPKSEFLYENLSDGDDFSEDDSLLKREKRKSATRELATPLRDLSVARQIPSKVSRLLAVVPLMLFSPLFIFGVNVFCSKSRCSFSLPNLKPYGKLQSWFSVPSATIYLSYISLQVLLSLIPYFGKTVPMPGSKRPFTANTLFSTLVTLIVAILLHHLKILTFDTIFNEYFQIIEVAVIYGVILSAVVFFLGRKAPYDQKNPSGNTGVNVYDYWVGREINPFIKKLNIKPLLVKSAMTAAFLINFMSLYQGISVKEIPDLAAKSLLEFNTYKEIASSVSFNPTLLLFSCMQMFYFLHGIFNEAAFVHTFEFQSEGTGLMLTLGYSLYPFTTPLIAKYTLEHNVQLSNLALVVTALVYLIGFFIYHQSNSQKNSFRKNPLDPALSHLESMPTFQGNRLLISGWWGFVRHPNYLGDIILHLSWAFATLAAPPALFIAATVVLLAHRAKRDEARCKTRYGAAWERYCRRVPYNLIPRIY